MRFALAFLITIALLSNSAMAQELKPLRTITVTGQAERKLVPYEAMLSVSVSASDAELKQAKSAHDEKLRKAMEILKSAGIAEAKIATGQSSIQPQYNEVDDPLPNNPAHRKRVREYRAMTQLMVTVQPIDRVAGLMEKLTPVLEDKTDNDWNWQDALNLNYTVSDPNKVRQEMASDAIKNAHAQAEQMAGAAGASLGAVYQITEGNVPMFARPMPMMAMAASNGARAMDAAPIAPPAGEQEVNASVTVTYELK